MSDLKMQVQCDYDELVTSMGLLPSTKNKKGSMDVVTEALAVEAQQTVQTQEPTILTPRALPTLKKRPSKINVELTADTVKEHSFYKKMHNTDLPDTELTGTDLKSPTARYVTQARNLNIVPTSLISTVMESVEAAGCISLANHSVGDDMAIALAHSITILFVLTLDMSGNHLTDKGVCALVESVDPHFIQDVNLSNIKVKKKVAEVLSVLIAETSTLSTLQMEGCSLDDMCVRILSTHLLSTMCPSSGVALHNCTLTTLNLSHNKIGDAGVVGLCECLKGNASLNELDLSYNLIRDKGGTALFDVLNETAISTLDLARNSMGGGGFAAAVGKCLEVSDTLIHLSLAFVGLSKEQCNEIGSKLKYNQVLMGLHMEGNQVGIDAHGYMNGVEEGGGGGGGGGGEGEQKHTFTRIMPWANSRVAEASSHWGRSEGKCWICHKWNEQLFTFSNSDKRAKVMLCTSFDEWKGESMTREPDGSFELYRMVPPGKIGYAFEVKGEEDQDGEKVVDVLQAKEDVDDLAQQLKPPEKFELLEVNVGSILARPKSEDDNIRLRPRTKADMPVIHNKKLAKGWTLKNSVFAAYKSDSKKILQAAFSSDYMRSKSRQMEEKMSEEDEKMAFRNGLMSSFPVLKQIFRHYGAAYSNEVWVVGVNAFAQLVTDLKILKDEEAGEGSLPKLERSSSSLKGKGGGGFSRVEADLIFVSSCWVGGKTLNRQQFLDAIVQLATCRFIKYGGETPPLTLARAVEKLAVEHVAKFAEKDPFPDFKEKFLYNKTADDIIREVKDKMLVAFKLHSGRDDTPGEAKTMSMGEYVELLAWCKIDGRITERATRLSFVRAKETVIDETDARSVHKKLKFVEFLEVMSRVAFAVYCCEKVGGSEREVEGMLVDVDEFYRCMREVFELVVGRADAASKKGRGARLSLEGVAKGLAGKVEGAV